MEALIILVSLGIVWLINPKRRWRRFLALIALTMLIGLTITSPWGVALATRGLTAALPSDSGEPVQMSVVLGRGPELRQRRLEAVEQLWRQQRSPQVFASGMLDAEFMVEQLQANGMTEAALSGEWCSQSTEENALFTSAVLYSKRVQKILLLTDSPHMLRSLLVFRSFGFTVIPYPIPLPDQWSAGRRSMLVLREYLGLLTYFVTGRFRQRSLADLLPPAADVTQKLVDWNCKLPRMSRS